MSHFYVRSGDSYLAQESTAGPWGKELQHGGPVAALLATRIERAAGCDATKRISQCALEFLSPVPVATLDVTTEVLRPGKKIAFWSARASVGGRDVARMTAWVLSAAEGRSPLVHLEDAPPPPMPATAVETYFTSVPRFPYGDALEWRFAEGAFTESGPATVWARLRGGIVEGEDVSPLARLLAMVDSANGVSAELDLGTYLFVPVNLTVVLARLPATEWTCMAAKTSMSTDGVGLTRAHLYDERGAIGEALQSLFVERRPA
ncbi:thioesterase family protein [soil metagenome]